MNRALVAAITLAAVLTIPAMARPMLAGSGDVASRDLAVGSFDSINLRGVPSFQIIPGDAPAVTVKTDANVASHLAVSVVDNQLQVTLDPSYRPTSFELDITMPRLTAASFFRSKGSIGQLKGDEIHLDLQGRSALSLDGVQAGLLDLNVENGSSVTGKENAVNTNLNLAAMSRVTLEGHSDSIELAADHSTADLTRLAGNLASVVLSDGADAEVGGNPQLHVDGIVYPGSTLTSPGHPDEAMVFYDADDNASDFGS
jgi:hypothetical protein